jgi:hypothetical protein
MNKLDMIFVRACKSSDPRKRLNSLYYRFYGVNERVGNENEILYKLACICEEYDLISITKLVNSLSPSNAWKYTDGSLFDTSYTGDPRFGLLLSTIRLSRVDKFPGFISCKKFRDKVSLVGVTDLQKV